MEVRADEYSLICLLSDIKEEILWFKNVSMGMLVVSYGCPWSSEFRYVEIEEELLRLCFEAC